MASDSAVFVELLNSALQDKVVFSSQETRLRSWELLYLKYGTLRVHDASGDSLILDLTAPNILLHPVSSGDIISVLAGSLVARVSFDENCLSAILGTKPEAAELSAMTTSRISLDLTNFPAADQAIASAFNMALAEDQETGIGRDTIIEALVRCILIHLWRNSALASETQGDAAAQTILLRRFRQLVEQHFRERWSVTSYAQALGCTADRLHNITTTMLGRTPSALIHQRLIVEAKSLLERSNLTVQQISGFLGFQSPSQFSNFFHKHQGVPPGQHRKEKRSIKNQSGHNTTTTIADWP